MSDEGALDALRAENARFRALLSRPYVGAWLDEVLLEAAHQRERWGVEHDGGKDPADWFWLVGYLAGKALRASIDGDVDKARHHTVSTAAVLAQWAAQLCGAESVMRPGLGAEAIVALERAQGPAGGAPHSGDRSYLTEELLSDPV